MKILVHYESPICEKMCEHSLCDNNSCPDYHKEYKNKFHWDDEPRVQNGCYTTIGRLRQIGLFILKDK